MIRFNVATKARRSCVRLRELTADFEQGGWVDAGPRPDEEAEQLDLFEAIQEQFSKEELELLMLWLDEMPWASIGEKIGCSADAARVRLSRAVARVKSRMNSEDCSGD
jgi:DNA-directed RNA polymerase specialized sigma24 family protein